MIEYEKNENLASWPPAKEAYEQIINQVEYGHSFEWSVVCGCMGMPVTAAEHPRDMKFAAQWMQLKKALEEKGYYSTERGMNNSGFRILTREEIADVVKGRLAANANRALRDSLSVSEVSREGLDELEVKKLDHWEEKSALIGATTKCLLRKRNLPSPEMAIKSIKQIK